MLAEARDIIATDSACNSAGGKPGRSKKLRRLLQAQILKTGLETDLVFTAKETVQICRTDNGNVLRDFRQLQGAVQAACEMHAGPLQGFRSRLPQSMWRAWHSDESWIRPPRAAPVNATSSTKHESALFQARLMGFSSA